MKITTLLRAAAVGMAAVTLGTIASFFFVATEKKYSHVIMMTGTLEGDSQRLVKLELAGQESDALIEEIDRIINGLLNGDQELDLPAARDPELREAIEEVQRSFAETERLIQQFRQFPDLRNKLVAASENLFAEIETSLTILDETAQASAWRLILIEAGILALELGFLALVLFATYKINSILRGSTSTLAGASNQIATAMQEQERTISQQASSVNQTTTTMEELGASSRQSADQAESCASGSRQALELADEGNRAVEQALEGMVILKEQVSSIAEQIMNLSEQTSQISLVSELVGNIASQTNMLALNASVEAARAGEQGKGFSVVAGEIRKLADQSKKSSEKISTLVRDIQVYLNSTVMVTDEGTKKADLGIKLAQETAETFSSVATAINNAFLNSQQIAMTAKQQAIAVQEVMTAINEIDLGAKETVAAIKQVKVSTEQLDREAQKLKAAV